MYSLLSQMAYAFLATAFLAFLNLLQRALLAAYSCLLMIRALIVAHGWLVRIAISYSI